MNLREWVEQHSDDLKAEQPRAAVIADLLAVADREIGDAESVLSDDGRLEHAFAACLAISAAALLACGYRTRHGAPSHHYLLIESLGHTLGLRAADVKELHDYRKKRSRSMYEKVGLITSTEAAAALEAGRSLRQQLTAWLTQNHADLTQT